MIGVVGLGLMGGSIALALEKKGVRWIGVDADPRVREAARRPVRGARRAERALARCSLVVLAAPVGAVEALLAPVSAVMADGAVLTDVAGVKVRIAELARTQVRRACGSSARIRCSAASTAVSRLRPQSS